VKIEAFHIDMRNVEMDSVPSVVLAGKESIARMAIAVLLKFLDIPEKKSV